jgi:4-amino-4-deoxy-L-arabinose transferase-like glycosyltransferase
MTRASLRDWGAAIALAAAFCFSGLGNHGLRASDEPRVAGIAWTMQHENRWLLPSLGGEPFLEHPPLYYALLGATLAALGPSDLAARLPGALAALATLLLAFALAKRLAGARAGIAALLLLIGMHSFFRYSHKVMVDALLACFVMLGYFAYVCAAWPSPRSDAQRHAPVSGPTLFALFAAGTLAFYVKGPVGPVLIFGPIAADLLLFRGLRFARSWRFAFFAALSLAACAAWPFWLQQTQGEAALREFVIQNGLLRIFPHSGIEAYTGGHQHSFLFYLPRIAFEIGWPIVLVPALYVWLRRGGPSASLNVPALRFLALVYPWGALLLSLPGTKRGLYLLPLHAPLAVALGVFAARLGDPDPLRSRVELATARWLPPLRLASIVFALSLAWNLFAYGPDPVRDLGPTAREMAEAAGAAQITGYSLDEAIQGAIPFYTGRSLQLLADDAQVARYFREHPDGRLLVRGPIGTMGGGGLVALRSWTRGDDAVYTLLGSGGATQEDVAERPALSPRTRTAP